NWASSRAPSIPAIVRASVARRKRLPTVSLMTSALGFQSRKLFRLIAGNQPHDDLVERLARHDLFDLVKRQIDAVVCDPALREVIGADPFRPVARPDLAFTQRRPLAIGALAFDLIQPGPQH